MRIHLVSEQILKDGLGFFQTLLDFRSIWYGPPSINRSNEVKQISVIA